MFTNLMVVSQKLGGTVYVWGRVIGRYSLCLGKGVFQDNNPVVHVQKPLMIHAGALTKLLIFVSTD